MSPSEELRFDFEVVIEAAIPPKKRARRGTEEVAEDGVPMRDIAEAIGRSLKVPAKSISMEEAPAHLGWLAMFADHDLLASSEKTRKKLGWNPTGPGLIADLERLGLPEG